MKVAVWDTYVKKKDGNVMHFDILVPEEMKDEQTIYTYGKAYCDKKNEKNAKIDMAACQFCHVEEPPEDVIRSIEQQGHYILGMEEIPAQLPVNATRRDMVLYLKGHYEQYRFANFKGISELEVLEMLNKVTR